MEKQRLKKVKSLPEVTELSEDAGKGTQPDTTALEMPVNRAGQEKRRDWIVSLHKGPGGSPLTFSEQKGQRPEDLELDAAECSC